MLQVSSQPGLKNEMLGGEKLNSPVKIQSFLLNKNRNLIFVVFLKIFFLKIKNKGRLNTKEERIFAKQTLDKRSQWLFLFSFG